MGIIDEPVAKKKAGNARRPSRLAAFAAHAGMTTTDPGETSHGCQGSQIFG